MVVASSAELMPQMEGRVQVFGEKDPVDVLFQTIPTTTAAAGTGVLQIWSSLVRRGGTAFGRVLHERPGRRPNARAKASNTFGTSSGRARRNAVIVTTTTITARMSTGTCIHNTVQPLFNITAGMTSTDMNTFRRQQKPPAMNAEGLTCREEKKPQPRGWSFGRHTSARGPER
ncbi:hypothetical protein [Nocardia gipuzkoensis]